MTPVAPNPPALRVWNVWSLLAASFLGGLGLAVVEWVTTSFGFSHSWYGLLIGLPALVSWTELRRDGRCLRRELRVCGLKMRETGSVGLPTRAELDHDWEGYRVVTLSSVDEAGGYRRLWFESRPLLGRARFASRINSWLRAQGALSDSLPLNGGTEQVP